MLGNIEEATGPPVIPPAAIAVAVTPVRPAPLPTKPGVPVPRKKAAVTPPAPTLMPEEVVRLYWVEPVPLKLAVEAVKPPLTASKVVGPAVPMPTLPPLVKRTRSLNVMGALVVPMGAVMKRKFPFWK